MDDLLDLISRVPGSVWLGLSGFSVVLALVSAALVPRLVVGLPEDLLLLPARPPLLARILAGPPARSLRILLRNLLGLGLLVLGFVMLFMPGQGLLTMLAGLGLTDFPGRQRLMLRLIRAPGVRRVVAHLRRRAGVAPLLGLDT